MNASARRRLAVLCYHSSPVGPLGSRDTGGMNVYVRETSRALAARGYLVDVFTRASGPEPEVEQLGHGVRLVRIAAGPAGAVDKQRLPRFLPEFTAGVAAFRIREGVHYDAIHSHYWLSGLSGLQLQRRWQVPHVTMFHTLGAAKQRARPEEREPAARLEAERGVARSVDRVVCATDDERTLLTRLYGVPDAAITTIPCGVDVELFRPLNKTVARRALGLGVGDEDRHLLLYVGRLEPLKGVDVAIAALAQSRAERPLLLIVGGDARARNEVRRLQAAARAQGVEGQVRFLGAVDQAALPRYYAAADVCVVPSYYESFGMAALEAQACGTPVVASRVGGLPDVVRDGETGFLVPWRCPDLFAANMDLLLYDRALAQRFGAAARAWALRFRWPVVAERLDDLYGSLSPGDACHPGADRWLKTDHVRCDVA